MEKVARYMPAGKEVGASQFSSAEAGEDKADPFRFDQFMDLIQ